MSKILSIKDLKSLTKDGKVEELEVLTQSKQELEKVDKLGL